MCLGIVGILLGWFGGKRERERKESTTFYIYSIYFMLDRTHQLCHMCVCVLHTQDHLMLRQQCSHALTILRYGV